MFDGGFGASSFPLASFRGAAGFLESETIDLVYFLGLLPSSLTTALFWRGFDFCRS